MSVPEGSFGSGGASRGTSKDALPLRKRGIYSYAFSMASDSVDESHEEIAVAGGAVAGPGAARAGIGFNIEPDSGE